jgi:Beta-lactamase enzyme family
MRRLRISIGVGVVALCAVLVPGAQVAPVLAAAMPAQEISTSATPAKLRSGHTVKRLVKARAYPTSHRVQAAARYLARRAGTKAFAVIDSRGRLAGVEMHRRFHSASVVKSMLLVAYLQMLAAQHRSVDGASEALLYPMIHASDNEAASAVLAIVGEAALDRVAREAHMVDYESGDGFWGFTEVSAADLARFFLYQEALIPRRFEGYARWLLSTIETSESWGIPAVARPEFEVFFKGGWLPESEGLVNQVARLERRGIVFALAVLTVHDPSMVYGEQTIEGVTGRLLGQLH